MNPASHRIGYVVKMFPRLSETFILNEILEMERHGLDLHLFSLKRPTDAVSHAGTKSVRAPITYLPEQLWREPGRVVRALTAVCRSHPRPFGHLFRHMARGRELDSLARGLRTFCQACCLVREMGGVRHLHAHFATDPTRLASWARMLCGVSFSVTTHAKDLYQGGRLHSPGLQLKLGRARFVVTNSRRTAADLRAAGPDRGATPIHTIYNGIDLDAFPLRPAEPAEPRILCVGRLVEKKGVQHLVRACHRLREQGVRFRCDVIGTGPLKEPIKKLAREFRLTDHFVLLGPMSQQQVREQLAQATVFALPCVVAADGDRDILPNVVKEAMAVGVPVVTTRLPAIEELVTHEHSGLLVAPGDAAALAAALQRLLSDASLRQRLARAGRTVIEERFDLRANFSQLKDLLLAQVQEPPAEFPAVQEKRPTRHVPA